MVRHQYIAQTVQPVLGPAMLEKLENRPAILFPDEPITATLGHGRDKVQAARKGKSLVATKHWQMFG